MFSSQKSSLGVSLTFRLLARWLLLVSCFLHGQPSGYPSLGIAIVVLHHFVRGTVSSGSFLPPSRKNSFFLAFLFVLFVGNVVHVGLQVGIGKINGNRMILKALARTGLDGRNRAVIIVALTEGKPPADNLRGDLVDDELLLDWKHDVFDGK